MRIIRVGKQVKILVHTIIMTVNFVYSNPGCLSFQTNNAICLYTTVSKVIRQLGTKY